MSSRHNGLIIGVDETGRGALFGPVVVCALGFPAGQPGAGCVGLTDSKALSRPRREALAAVLHADASFAFGCASAAEVDALNPLRATLLAMTRAVSRLRCPIARVLVDGRDYPPLAWPGEAVIKGDATVPQISAASILAKVFRDALVARLAQRYPGYGLDRHAGYGTAAHFAAITRLGPTPHHRRTFLRKLALRQPGLHQPV